jgi:hypothetical protein
VDPKAVSLCVQGIGLPACLCPEHGVFVADGGYGMRPRWHNDTHERTDARQAPQDPYHRERYSHDHGIHSGVFGDMNAGPGLTTRLQIPTSRALLHPADRTSITQKGCRFPPQDVSQSYHCFNCGRDIDRVFVSLKKGADSRLKMYHNLIIVLIVVAI